MCINGFGVCSLLVGLARMLVGPTQRKVVLVVVSLVRRMTVTIMEVVDVVVVLYRWMAAVGAVFVRVSLGLQVSSASDPPAHAAV
jgi:hypothetical protein